ncbi:hypothetical protein [Oceanobacillus jordanicus]|uniref:Uncharacterized protein n=1 Tax=Oceanobacillus jordanicus TaxID=2867266 RepID=A0AAW5B9T5_9BACI|nr:hypothetical protein [Oceanobacillus jordanicus]MCG3420002.1 hypothetical protein [Oceanobacillus jordanicus]
MTIPTYNKVHPTAKDMKDHKVWDDVECLESEFFHEKKAFNCPEVVPAGVEEDFCLPKDCPERLPQKKYPSANTAFPPKEFEEIRECIERANELLLALAVGGDEEEAGEEADEPNARALQQSLRTLRELFVTVHFSYKGKTEKISGCFIDAGLDFIIIENADTGNISIIPTTRILSIQYEKQEDATVHEQELLTINPCLRRNLTFHFGETVTKSPFLINLFFGLNLSMFLESYMGYYCYVKTDIDKYELDGTLEMVKENFMSISKYEEKFGIDFDVVCVIELEE